MSDHQNNINQLLAKLEFLLKRQDNFTQEIKNLREEVIKLKKIEADAPPTQDIPSPIENLEETGEEKVNSEIPDLIEETPQYKSTSATNKLARKRMGKVFGGVCGGFGRYFGIDAIWVRIIYLILTFLSFGTGIVVYVIFWILLKEDKVDITHQTYQKPIDKPLQNVTPPIAKKSTDIKSDLEKFIGENLINKIGIAILVIGVGIGAKYTIDNNLITPLTRIILGYLIGLGLLGLGLKLKEKYDNFSAVLVSGAMAILYFITFAAYSFYELIPQIVTFILMVVFTIFTVIAALNYNKQIIAHIGLVGAYAVPFLLSNDSGQAEVLFSYIAIINIGILAIAYRKYWKPLLYVSFLLTWLIYFSWFNFRFLSTDHFTLAWTFLIVFFTIFYTIFLAYKLIKKEKFEIQDILLILSNSFIFYGLGYTLLDDHETANQFLGLFTLGNAIIHLIVASVIYQNKLVDKNLFYLISGLVLVFITIAVPVQLNGNWVTLLWTGEAALLFFIGRTKNAGIYEKISYPIMLLACISIMQDWGLAYNNYLGHESIRFTPILNVHFLSSTLFIAAFWYINHLNQNKNYKGAFENNRELSNLVSISIPAILIVSTYLAFRLEIANYWDQLYRDSAQTNGYLNNYHMDLKYFKTIWLIIYTMFFASILSFINIKRIKNSLLGTLNLGFNALILSGFLIKGLYDLSELRESYLSDNSYYQGSLFNLGIRYLSFIFVGVLLTTTYHYVRQKFIKQDLKIIFDLVLHTTIIWIASSELLHWMDLGNASESYKLGLSILWGVYALLLIVLGIYKKQKYVRIAAITLFGVTLIKLFFYDISHLNTISKTIVLVSLGVLLLIISFLYNKYKDFIADEIKD